MASLLGQQPSSLIRAWPRTRLPRRSKFPAHFLELGREGLAPQPPAFGPAHLVHRLVQMLHDVEAVQDVQGVARLLAHHLQIGLPHVAADEAQTARPPAGPSAFKPRRKVALVRRRPTHSSRRQCPSI